MGDRIVLVVRWTQSAQTPHDTHIQYSSSSSHYLSKGAARNSLVSNIDGEIHELAGESSRQSRRIKNLFEKRRGNKGNVYLALLPAVAEWNVRRRAVQWDGRLSVVFCLFTAVPFTVPPQWFSSPTDVESLTCSIIEIHQRNHIESSTWYNSTRYYDAVLLLYCTLVLLLSVLLLYCSHTLLSALIDAINKSRAPWKLMYSTWYVIVLLLYIW